MQQNKYDPWWLQSFFSFLKKGRHPSPTSLPRSLGPPSFLSGRTRRAWPSFKTKTVDGKGPAPSWNTTQLVKPRFLLPGAHSKEGETNRQKKKYRAGSQPSFCWWYQSVSLTATPYSIPHPIAFLPSLQFQVAQEGAVVVEDRHDAPRR